MQTFSRVLARLALGTVLGASAAMASANGLDLSLPRDSGQPVSPRLYQQKGFDATPHAREFSEWKVRFIADKKALFAQIEKNILAHDLSAEESDALRQRTKDEAFRNSIDGGKKGRSLVNFMEQALLAPPSQGAQPGISVGRLIDNEHSRAVGFGGTFDDGGRQVELWYVVFHDIASLTNGELREIASYSVFKPLTLPKLNEVKRMSWPAMTFVRDGSGRLMLWSLSQEQFQIVDRMHWKSLM